MVPFFILTRRLSHQMSNYSISHCESVGYLTVKSAIVPAISINVR